MWHRRVDHAHRRRLIGAVVEATKEDLSRLLLPHHAREVGRAKAGVKAGDVRVRLLEDRVLFAGERQVADDVQAVTATDRPARTTAITTLGMKRIRRCTSRMCKRAAWVDLARACVLVFVAIFAANALVAS